MFYALAGSAIVFFGTVILGTAISHNYDDSLGLGIVLGGLALVVILSVANRHALSIHRPQPQTFRLKYSKVYGEVKHVVRNVLDPPDQWRLQNERQDKGEMTFSLTLESLIDRKVLKHIRLRALIDTTSDRQVRLTLKYDVFSESMFTPDCDIAITRTTKQIHDSLRSIEALLNTPRQTKQNMGGTHHV